MGKVLKVAAIIAIICSVLFGASTVLAAHGNDILGLWRNEEHDAVIEIYKCADKYCGKIVWIRDPSYPQNDLSGRAGQPRLDDNDTDPKMRQRPIVGLKIMEGFSSAGKDEWTGGTVYDPKSGRTYRGKIYMVSPNKLHLRGYVLFSFLGRTATWTRVDH